MITKAKAIFSLLGGILLVLFSIHNLISSPFDKSRGIDYFLGQIMF